MVRLVPTATVVTVAASLAALLMVSPVSGGRLGAQQPVPAISAGARVRVTAPSVGLVREVARVQSVRGDSLVLRRDRDGVVVVTPAAAVQSIDVSRSRRRHIGTGVFLGYAIMFALGFAGHPGMAHTDAGPTVEAVGYGIVYGTPVALFGGFVGASIRKDRWAPVSLPLDVGASSSSGGSHLGARIRF